MVKKTTSPPSSPTDRILNRVYKSTLSPGGLGGVSKLLTEAKKFVPGLSRYRVKEFLKSKRSYTLHFLQPKRFARRKIIASKPRVIFSCDLADVSLLNRQNRGIKYLLVCVDVFSRYLQVQPLQRKDGLTVKKALADILENNSLSRGVSRLHVDRGKEFYNERLQAYLKDKKIKLYSTYSDVKAAHAERAIRTLKGKIYRYLTEYNTLSYYRALPSIVSGLNNTPHRGLKGATPESVHHLRDPVKIASQFRDMYKTPRSTPAASVTDELIPGTYVRLVGGNRTAKFARGFYQQNTEEQFVIDRVDKTSRDIPVYYLKDLDGERLKGLFYAQELVPAALPVDYQVDVLKTRRVRGKKQFFVHFRGYDRKFDRWVDDLTRI